jgi:hypothetical protein
LGICADNTNSNFGGRRRHGTGNIFYKIKADLGKDLIGVGCAAHIINNSIQTAADCLPVDVMAFISKIYSYFYIYTVRVNELKEFCEFVQVEYKKVLGYSARVRFNERYTSINLPRNLFRSTVAWLP